MASMRTLFLPGIPGLALAGGQIPKAQDIREFARAILSGNRPSGCSSGTE